jgi:serine/threonine-protein kinase HipA
MIRSLTLWWGGTRAGELRIDEHGDLAFVYSAEWLADPGAPAISISLPKRAEPFPRRETRPFFAGLLPKRGSAKPSLMRSASRRRTISGCWSGLAAMWRGR